MIEGRSCVQCIVRRSSKRGHYRRDVGLALVNDLNPVSYHRINSSSDDIEMGLLAQEVEEVLAAHGLSNSGMVHQASEDAYRSVRYNDLLAPMIRAIQELDDAAEAKDQQIASLEQRLQSQQEELLAVVQSPARTDGNATRANRAASTRGRASVCREVTEGC